GTAQGHGGETGAGRNQPHQQRGCARRHRQEPPFPIYRQFGVPVALSTDDEGIERIDLTHEYARAVESYDLSYADLKQLVRNSLEYSFLPGVSLWAGSDFARLADSCRNDAPGVSNPSPACETFLKGSEKAGQQWELERRFA